MTAPADARHRAHRRGLRDVGERVAALRRCRRPALGRRVLSGAMSLLLLGRRTHPVAMSVALLVLVLPTAAFVVNPSDLISTFFPLLILAYGGRATPRRAGASSCSG